MFTRKTHHWGWSPWEWIHFKITFKPWPNETESWWELTRVDESWNSRSHLARNSHSLSATHINSRELSSNLNLHAHIFHDSWQEFCLAWPRTRVWARAWRSAITDGQQLLFFFSAGTDWNGKIIWRRTRGPRTTPRLLKKKNGVTRKFCTTWLKRGKTLPLGYILQRLSQPKNIRIRNKHA